MSIHFKHIGNFSKTLKFLNVITNKSYLNRLDIYGEAGVAALSAATPVRTGLTAASWKYEITDQNGITTISWFNTNVQNGVNIAVLINYGHGTGLGTYVRGRQFIDPAMRPVFDKIAEECWKEIKNA
jgi:hypothetical protein